MSTALTCLSLPSTRINYQTLTLLLLPPSRRWNRCNPSSKPSELTLGKPDRMTRFDPSVRVLSELLFDNCQFSERNRPSGSQSHLETLVPERLTGSTDSFTLAISRLSSASCCLCPNSPQNWPYQSSQWISLHRDGQHQNRMCSVRILPSTPPPLCRTRFSFRESLDLAHNQAVYIYISSS